MLNLNGNGTSNLYDYVNLLRYLLMTVAGMLLGYTISDWHPDKHKQFTLPTGQFVVIFSFLVTGIVKFKNNKNWKFQIIFMGLISLIFVYILNKIKKYNHSSSKKNI